MRRLVPVLLGLVLSGCATATQQPVAAPSASTSRTAGASAVPSASPSPSPSPAPAWVVGATPLPVGPDGFGVASGTPVVLRDRHLQQPDLLPPPAGGRWASVVAPVTPAVRARMGTTWSPACPVALADLRLLTVAFRGFDGRPHSGQLVVAATVADDVVEVFRRLYAAGFPIEEMRLPTTADMQAPPTGDGNLTAGYVCRAARGQTRFSSHAYGTAIDLDPFQNPSVKRGRVLPELAGAYADRTVVREGMHLPGGPAVEAFEAVGWTWGGTWTSSKDWMHFSADGR
ncbi:MAG: hypothetical protein JWO60_2239 [Frankiales bacterium]|nr:hypothetical protein [Frankiales bacterium]